jgi:hypothetical protein
MNNKTIKNKKVLLPGETEADITNANTTQAEEDHSVFCASVTGT